MTEKRFTRKSYSIWDNLKNEEFYELHYRYEVDDMCDKLNKVYEENEQLKKQRYNLYGDVARLVRENEQLKKELHRVYDDDYYLKQFIMAIVTIFSSGNDALSKCRYKLIVDACEMNKTSLKEFFK